MRKALRIRTWPVFLLGIGSLLALSFLPGLVVLRRTATIYPEIHRLLEAQRETQRHLAEVERHVYLVSITVREALLDSSATSGVMYRASFEDNRREIQRHLAELRRLPAQEGKVALPKLERELDGYFEAIAHVFEWTPAQRTGRAVFFLREQQRPRRRTIIAIADEISRLTEASYSRQLDQMNQGQLQFADDSRRVIALAFFLGVLIAGLTIARIVHLEERAERQRSATERAEEELRSLSTQLMHAQEEERRTISRELHDEVGQILTGVRMGLGGLSRLRDNPDEFERQSAEVKSLAEQALRTVRDLAVGLRPSVLDLGLVPALQWLARRFSSYSGLPVTVHAEPTVGEMPENHCICIYRVVQECLTNAVKHSGAKSVRVDIGQTDGMLEVAVRDDGIGISPTRAVKGGLGLIGMEERVRELSGTLRVESPPSGGTAIVVRLSLPELPDGEPS
ncbi:MAG: histidine kinase [Acidobacteriota bacterium]